MNLVILENLSFIGHGTMIGSYHCQKNRGKTVILSRVSETHFEESNPDHPHPLVQNITVLTISTLV